MFHFHFLVFSLFWFGLVEEGLNKLSFYGSDRFLGKLRIPHKLLFLKAFRQIRKCILRQANLPMQVIA